MGGIDPAFIQDVQHRPKAAIAAVIEAEGIPLIDLSAAEDLVVEEVRRASSEWGFFQVINHGVPLETLRRVEEAARNFFGLAMDEKKKTRRDEAGPLGYYETEHTKNVRDWKEVFDFTSRDPILIRVKPEDDELTRWSNKWPQNPPEMREACEAYAREVEKLAFRLMELIALSLGLPPDRFRGFFQDQQTTFIRLNHYPPCPAPHLALGVGRHKDAGALTILTQDDVGGLEVRRKSDGEWVRVRPTPNAYIINIGDIIQVWSNEAYESVEHRVMVNSERERFSIPFFFNPSHDTTVDPLEELVSDHNPSKYSPYSWGEFLVTRKRSNFMKLDVENIQIHHFRLPDKKN